ncbi:predicted protein [Histoplasma capsulatum H143]|uniref:Uncharacterized protein n=1 Tax=Ajellomyces capsulatus (strain H143) TaxID=544712 RepID=C6HLT1_AJECH|nr:predicted protein [Histoplasma capsulatum H143]
MDFGKWEQAGQGWGKVGRGMGILKKRGHVFFCGLLSKPICDEKTEYTARQRTRKVSPAYNELYKKKGIVQKEYMGIGECGRTGKPPASNKSRHSMPGKTVCPCSGLRSRKAIDAEYELAENDVGMDVCG